MISTLSWPMLSFIRPLFSRYALLHLHQHPWPIHTTTGGVDRLPTPQTVIVADELGVKTTTGAGGTTTEAPTKTDRDDAPTAHPTEATIERIMNAADGNAGVAQTAPTTTDDDDTSINHPKTETVTVDDTAIETRTTRGNGHREDTEAGVPRALALVVDGAREARRLRQHPNVPSAPYLRKKTRSTTSRLTSPGRRGNRPLLLQRNRSQILHLLAV